MNPFTQPHEHIRRLLERLAGPIPERTEFVTPAELDVPATGLMDRILSRIRNK